MGAAETTSILDLNVLVAIHEVGSVRGVARRLQLNPSHVSKILKRLEQKLGKSLFKTSSRGIILTREANDIVGYAQNILLNANKLASRTLDPSTQKEVLTIGSLSFLNKSLVSRTLDSLAGDNRRFRLLDLSPDQLPLAGFKGIIEFAVHTNPDKWTKAWDVKKIGSIRWALIARRGHAVLKNRTLDEVLRHPFVVPTYWDNSHYVSGNDFFPVNWSERIKGHEASTADTALQLVLSTNHLAFLPAILLHSPTERLLEEVSLPDLPTVRKDVFLLTKMDRIKKKTQLQFLQHLTATLKLLAK